MKLVCLLAVAALGCHHHKMGQRNFILNIGKQNGVLLSGITRRTGFEFSPGTAFSPPTKEEAFFPIPNIRTKWEIQNIVFEYDEAAVQSNEGIKFKTGKKTLNLNIYITSAGQKNILTIIPFNVPEFELTENPQEIIKFPKKAYVLELFSPIEIIRGEQVQLTFESLFSSEKEHEEITKLFLQIINPRVILLVDQQYPSYNGV